MKTILIVDDMEVFREPLEAILRAHGFSALLASNGQEALALIVSGRPDLVLLDLGMPVMDGLTTLREMRSRPASKSTPVIVLSAETDRSRIVDAMKLGISSYVLKTNLSMDKMLDRVREALAASAPQAARASHPTSAAPAVRAASATPAPRPLPTSRNHSPAGPPGHAPSRRAAPDAAERVKQLKPILTRSDLLERLREAGELTGFSPTISHAIRITSSDECSMEQVAKAVSQDHALALKVLRLANSSVYSRGDRVDTLQKAVLRIGMQGIRQAVLNIGMVERFAAPAFDGRISTPLFWEHAIACGTIAAELAHALKQQDADTAFTAGLLHDLGRVILAERLGEEYVRVLDAAQSMHLPLEQVESRLLHMSHAEVMDGMLHAWHFPRELVRPIVLHHAPPDEVGSLAGRQAAETLRLGLADRLAHAMLLGDSGNDTIYPTTEHCRLLGVEPGTIQQIETKARELTTETKLALLSNTGGAAWPEHARERRAQLSVPFRPLFIGASPETDAFRIFCAELAGPSTDEPPNLAVVHIGSAKERGALLERLLEAERGAGAQRLPLLMLSPGGQFVLEQAALAGRRSEILPTPTPVSEFITALNSLTETNAMQSAA